MMVKFCYVLFPLSLTHTSTHMHTTPVYILGYDVLLAVGWDQKSLRIIDYTEFMLQNTRYYTRIGCGKDTITFA